MCACVASKQATENAKHGKRTTNANEPKAVIPCVGVSL